MGEPSSSRYALAAASSSVLHLPPGVWSQLLPHLQQADTKSLLLTRSSIHASVAPVAITKLHILAHALPSTLPQPSNIPNHLTSVTHIKLDMKNITGQPTSPSILPWFSRHYHLPLSTSTSLELHLPSHVSNEMAEGLRQLLGNCPKLASLDLHFDEHEHLGPVRYSLKQHQPGEVLHHLPSLFPPLPVNPTTQPPVPPASETQTPDVPLADLHRSLWCSAAFHSHLVSLSNHRTSTYYPHPISTYYPHCNYRRLNTSEDTCSAAMLSIYATLSSELPRLTALTSLGAMVYSQWGESDYQQILMEPAPSVHGRLEGLGALQGLKHLRLTCYYNSKDRDAVIPSVPAELPQLTTLILEHIQVPADSWVHRLPALLELKAERCRFEPCNHGLAASTKLQVLKLVGCRRLGNGYLKRLDEIVYMAALTDLKELWLEEMSGEELLPPTISALHCLTSLVLCECTEMSNLPDEMFCLTNLRSIDMASCEGLPDMPDVFGSLVQLQKLRIDNWYNLRCLPDTIGQLSCLESLEITDCFDFCTLPHSVSNLGQLTSLQVHRPAEEFAFPPDAIEALTGLVTLMLGKCDCEPLGNLGQLSNLQTLCLEEDCQNMESVLDSVAELRGLRTLKLSAPLDELPSSIINLAHSLTKLELPYCSLVSLPDSIARLCRLEVLILVACIHLRELPSSIGDMGSLQVLDLAGCKELQSLPDTIGGLHQLRELNMSRCGSIRKLPLGVTSLSNLRVLHLVQCTALEGLPPGMEGLTQLQVLDVTGCGEAVLASSIFAQLRRQGDKGHQYLR